MKETPAPLKLGDYTAELFEPLVGEIFRFASQDSVAVELELLEVRRSKGRTTSQGRYGFSLLFALRSASGLGTGLLALQRDGYDPEGWFVNRVSVLGGDPGIAYCEAVFT